MTPARAARLFDLLDAAGIAAPVAADRGPEIRRTRVDSRLVEPGDAFVAIRGLHDDGERHAPDAVRRGATAILAAGPRPAWLAADVAWVPVAEPRAAAARLSRECHGRPDERLTLVGVTGTNGKTTVTYLVEAIARAAGRRVGRIGTNGYAFGGESGAIARTTPEAPELHELLARMLDRGVALVAMEVSSHALALRRVEGLRFGVAAFLNLGRDHLDYHGDAESYFLAKASLFDGLGPGAHAVLPDASPHGDRIARTTRARVLRFGRSASADVRIVDERHDVRGCTATLLTPAGPLAVRSALPGRFNLDNVAAAAACALALGLPARAVPDGIAALGGVPGRVERVDLGQPFAVLVDYAHTEEALRSVLADLRPSARGRLLVVFGCGGDRDRGKRAAMGRAAAAGADALFLTSDNPRDEDPLAILREIHRGVEEVAGASERSAVLPDREAAIAAAIAAAREGDVVIVAGKGHETTQTAGGEVRPFDDRIVARAALRARGFGGGRDADA